MALQQESYLAMRIEKRPNGVAVDAQSAGAAQRRDSDATARPLRARRASFLGYGLFAPTLVAERLKGAGHPFAIGRGSSTIRARTGFGARRRSARV